MMIFLMRSPGRDVDEGQGPTIIIKAVGFFYIFFVQHPSLQLLKKNLRFWFTRGSKTAFAEFTVLIG